MGVRVGMVVKVFLTVVDMFCVFVQCGSRSKLPSGAFRGQQVRN